tara:strand:- start:8 stop:166 length:159 start_codon:yes stop_codon:yes gene_type:complete
VWSTTRNSSEAFRWFKNWSAKGFNIGLKFLRDDDVDNAGWQLKSLQGEKIAA